MGKQWKLADDINYPFNPVTVHKWDDLVDAWLNSPDIPIIFRKRSSELRGCEIKHSTGRKIIISDNSPAQWVCYNALKDIVPTLDTIRSLLEKDDLPIAIVLRKAEKDKAKYKRLLKEYSINKFGWKLCHKKSVGLNTTNKIADIDIKKLDDSFLNLMKPSNFFLIPKRWGGLGELPEFIDGITC